MPFLRLESEAAQDSTDSSAFRLIHTKNQSIPGKPSNLTGTKLEIWAKKFVSSHSDSDDFEKAWQDRLLIATEKRIFILTKKKLNVSSENSELSKLRNSFDLRTSTDFQDKMDRGQGRVDLEIVDSIPTDEITGISLGEDHVAEIKEANLNHSSFITRSFRNTASKLNLLSSDNNDETLEIQRANRKATFEAADLCLDRFLKRSLQSSPSACDNFCEQILSITTAPTGFNRGQTYHFLLRKQDYPCVDPDDYVPMQNRADAEALAARLAALAARRRAESARETRFLRLQLRLRRAWDSIPFNLVVLVLIVSNFVFTVEQLQNIDPARQPFFEQVDLVYTVIFALGQYIKMSTHSTVNLQRCLRSLIPVRCIKPFSTCARNGQKFEPEQSRFENYDSRLFHFTEHVDKK